MTLPQVQAWIASKGQERLAYLVGKYPDIVEPFLGKITARIAEIERRGSVKKMLAEGPKYARKGVSVRRPGGVEGDFEYESSAAGYDRGADGRLTDREGWTEAAALLPSVIPDQPAELVEALQHAFREEAGRAAA